MMLFALCAILIANGKVDFLPLSFDSGGVTTGPITVPFIMALGVGIASTIGGRNSTENSFGLIAMCSIGPILAVMVLALTAQGNIDYKLADYSVSSALDGIWNTLLEHSLDVLKALALIVAFFLILQFTVLRLPRKSFCKLLLVLRTLSLGWLYF